MSQERQLQFVCGIRPGLYWIVAICWDMIVYSPAVLFGILIMVLFQIPIYSAHMNLPATALLLLLYG